VHVNQFQSIGGLKAAVEKDCLSADHLEVLTNEDLEVLKRGNTMPVALPGCSLFLGIPYTPGRRIIDSGLPLALASDCNPGSAPSFNMNTVVSLACIAMKLLPAEALNAATLNAASAMELSGEMGSITPGKKARIIITEPVSGIDFLPYSFGENLIKRVLY
jgi:imidazolonepropionase